MSTDRDAQAMTLDEHIGSRIRQLRVDTGQPVDRIAATLSLPLENYLAFEAGERRIPTGTMVDIALLFQVPLASLFDGFEASQTLGSTHENLS